MSDELLARIFEEWERQYRETPERFMAAAEQAGLELATYGENAAFTFKRIAAEVAIDVSIEKAEVAS